MRTRGCTLSLSSGHSLLLRGKYKKAGSGDCGRSKSWLDGRGRQSPVSVRGRTVFVRLSLLGIANSNGEKRRMNS